MDHGNHDLKMEGRVRWVKKHW